MSRPTGRVRAALRRLIRPAPERGARGLTLPASWLQLLRAFEVDLVVDVGANRGQYARALRRGGYGGRIACFEPLSVARRKLERRARGDELMETYPYALGDVPGPAVMHIAGNLGSSSLFEMLDRHRRAAPHTATIGEETVDVRRFDGLAADVLRDATRPWMKLDVQGYELAVLRGAGDALDRFCALQAELSTVPLYAGAPTRREIDRFLEGEGFVLAGVQQGFSDPGTGQMLQLDGLYARLELLEPR